jgi:alkylation response protein AidB-like acyl-CoA dehydrogenase
MWEDLPDGTECATILRRIDEQITPAITEYRASLEQERHLPAPLFSVLADAGLFRLWLPKALGGPELAPNDFMRVVEAVAALDGSAGWIVGNGGGMSRIAGYMPRAAAEAWFANPRAFVVSGTGAVGEATVTEGGYRVTGRWPFGSGIHSASHAAVLCRIVNGAGATTLLCCIDIADVEVIDNWHVSGLRGTGSCDFLVKDVFVPAAHCCAFPDIVPTQPGPVYGLPALSAFSWTVATVPLGIARGALDNFAALAARRSRSGNPLTLRDQETVQALFGRSETDLAAARALLRAAMAELIVAGPAGGVRLLRARAMFRMSCANAAETANGIVERLAAAAGSAALMQTGSLERCLRDVHAASRHIAMSQQGYVTGGRIALGLDAGPGRL